MIERLIKFYQLSDPGSESGMNKFWAIICANIGMVIRKALASGDVASVAKVLETSVANNYNHGIEDVVNWQHYGNGNKFYRQAMAEGLNMALPNFLGFKNEMGAPMGFISHSIMSLIIRDHNGGKYPTQMLEIGPGLGFMAVAMFRVGVKSYTMIDLPSNAVPAAYVVMKCIGEENVWLYGEPENDAAVRVFPSTNYWDVMARKYDVIYNKNSFPEIPNHAQDDYLEVIADCLDMNGFFISVNHEHLVWEQRPLPEAIKLHPSLKRISREPFSDMIAQNTMLEDLPGYFKEIYRRG
jgi:hypothetical protein